MQADRLAFMARRQFPGENTAVGQARRFAQDILGLHWPGLDDVLLILSEITSNAVRHTASGHGGWFTVDVLVTGNTARVEVADRGGPSRPAMAGDAGGELGMLTTGRGLRIVDVLADRWGHDGDESGRVVWFEITGKPGD